MLQKLNKSKVQKQIEKEKFWWNVFSFSPTLKKKKNPCSFLAYPGGQISKNALHPLKIPCSNPWIP